jgi:hypothetical protein
MVSGILLLTKLGPDTKVKIASASKLAKAIYKETADLESISNVYIADLPLDRACIEEVYSALEMLTKKGAKLHLYDHHFGWNEPTNALRFRPLFQTYEVNEKKTTAAVLIWYEFLNRDLDCQRWLELISKKDNSPDESVSDDFRLLAALMQPKYARRKSEIMHCLATGMNIEDRKEIVNWYVNEHLQQERLLAENVEVFETQHGQRIGWLDLRDEEGLYSNISKLVVEYYSVDLMASVIRNGVVLGGASIDRGIDLSFLHGFHSFEGISLEVVGHKSPVRFRPVDGEVTSEFVHAVKSLIVETI